jgi:glucan 1,3-beta-glucosidase
MATFFNMEPVAIIQLWNWGWTYMGLDIQNCGKGIDMSAGGSNKQDVGSITVVDSTIANTPVGIVTAWTTSSKPSTAGSIVLENIVLQNVPVAVQGPNGTLLTGSNGSTTISAWSEGHRYTPNGPNNAVGAITPNSRPSALLSGGKYYTRSKPLYADRPASDFVSVRSAGAKGDAAADDTAAIQRAIDSATSAGKIVFIDYGLYRVTSAITIPPGAKIVGEGYPVLMASGNAWSDINNPKPVIKIGATSGQTGAVELQDFVVGTQGAQPGAVLFEYNLASSGTPSAMWDVHTRIGGFVGSQLLVAQCLKKPGSSEVNKACIGNAMSMHITKKSSGLYLENTWFWVADHDIEDATNTQTTIYGGRGVYVESEAGAFWFVGTASEHHVLYNYQFVGTRNIFASELQTETPYFQPTPNALVPFPALAAWNDPDFSAVCSGVEGNCAAAWGLRVIDSRDIVVYGAGHYSFFSSYSTTCSTVAAGENCQSRIVSLEGNLNNVNIYNLNTIGSLSMINRDGRSLARWQDNVNVYPANIAVFRLG